MPDIDRLSLERRVSRLETQIRRLSESKEAAELHASEEFVAPIEETMKLLESEDLLAAPWLFSCQIGTPSASLQALLEFTPDTTEELDVRQWNSEADMWVAFLEDLPPDVPLLRPDSLALHDLRNSARAALIDLCKSELLLILREVPGRTEAVRNVHSITLVAILAAALSEAWTRVERMEQATLGRIAMVLEGENIGTRLRAGRHKFVIEPLN